MAEPAISVVIVAYRQRELLAECLQSCVRAAAAVPGGTELIAVEVKSFVSTSPVTDFHQALGQFINYRIALADKEPGRTLYLAVPEETFEAFFDPESQEIRQWIQNVIGS